MNWEPSELVNVKSCASADGGRDGNSDIKTNISFEFFDIDKNPEALKEMLLKLRNAKISTQNLGIPVVDKNGVIYMNNGVFEEFLQKIK